ncbi:uncharacterized protein ACA1_173150 [Acanthamoeba castellanii str. Neff]|uniref:PH domain-containing protein n=1 Tax=Acanthamoeba castellanii (strain ATCC 30010 / Neff) TaxID=1257118 RepID=L8HHL2_ACACF|nr:uncharacterized protein ACA1_173150 [Acanthamoeba castellanii str. Neff]ELR24687.1 hypothetical protein ACA1_173150 [Acanthamoeba castellanii str. Neff]
MKSLLSSSLGRQSPSFTQRMEAKKRQEEEEEARKRRHSSSPHHHQRLGLSSSYNGPSTLRSFLYSNSPSTAQTNAPDTATSDEDSSMETMVVIEGFLTKQGQRFKTWKRRCGTPNVERDDLQEDGERQPRPLGRKGKLYYAKQPQSRSSRGEVTLDHFSVLDISTGSLDEEAMALLPSDLMPTGHCFCVNTQKRVYYFCCDTAEDLVRWQRALQSLMPHNQNRSDDDIQQRQPRLEREVRHLFRDICEVMRDHDVDGGNVDENHHHHDNDDDGSSSHVNGDDDSDPEEADYVAKGKEAIRDGSFSPGSQKKKKGNRKEEQRREKEREWLRVIEAEVQQAETIEDEDERREEWVRLKQALTKGMERALLHSDRRRAELTLRAAAAKASSMMADGSTSTSDESEGEAAKKQKNEEGKDQKNESDGAAAAKERRSESGAAGRRREGTRRAGGRDEDDQDDGWNSDGFDTSREATLAREIMGKRGDDSGHRDDEGLYGDDSDGGLDDQGSDDTEDEEDGLLESDKRRHAKRKRKSRQGRKKAPTRRIYSYGQEENIGFEGEPETEQSFAGGGGTYGTYGAQRKSGDDGHQRDFDPTRTSSSFSFWSCFCC